MSTLKLLSWNVNGIRAAHKKGFMDWFRVQDADILCLQETKAQPDQIPDELQQIDGYNIFYESAEKKGYSGVALFSKREPISLKRGLDDPKFDNEGRVLCAEYPEFFLYGIYFPNGQRSQERLDYKLAFYEAFLEHAEKLRSKGKGVIFTGDINTAHHPIDLARPKPNEKNSGFLPVERAWIDRVVARGYTDTFRMFNQDGENYTYWDNRFRARDRNVGWRIDYFFVSDELKPIVKNAAIHPDTMGSDHCPISLELEV